MPRKKDRDKTYGEKLIQLFALLLFSQRSYSLTELAEKLNCSKQSVLRLLADIGSSYSIPLVQETQGNRHIYHIERPGSVRVSLTSEELAILEMCRAFTEHLMGKDQFEKAASALLKNRGMAGEAAPQSGEHFAIFRPGTIDYTPYQKTIAVLLKALDEKKVCKITYQPLQGSSPSRFYIKPLKLFTHKETMYIHARRKSAPGKKYHEYDFDPLLAVHRIKDIQITETSFEFPKDYDFEEKYNQSFGIIKEKAFQVTAEFSADAARYISERVWSKDQKISRKNNGAIVLTFTASSEPEVITWLLSFGDSAKLLSPPNLVKEIAEKAKKVWQLY